MANCEICGKPTTSHEVGEYFVCHTCWTENSSELQELKKQNKKREQQMDEIRGAGKRISEEIEDAESVERVRSLLGDYQKNLNLASELSAKPSTFNIIIDDACEPLSDKIFDLAKEKGWSFLLDLVDLYPPAETPDSMPIVNPVSRYVILTHWSYGVEEIPVEALEYLTKFDEGMDEMWEDSFACGWGLGHPEFDFVGVLESGMDKGQTFWAVGALEQGFYADQEKASEILIDFLEAEDLSEDVKYDLVQCVAMLGHREWDSAEIVPHYWNWKEALEYGGFEWNEEVKRDLRKVIEVELDDQVSKFVDEWDFYDLAFR